MQHGLPACDLHLCLHSQHQLLDQGSACIHWQTALCALHSIAIPRSTNIFKCLHAFVRLSKSVGLEVTCGDVCQVMGWVNQYHDTLRDLGIEEDELGFPTGSDRGIGMLTDKYIERMRQQLNAWCSNILEVPTPHHTTCLLACCHSGIGLASPSHYLTLVARMVLLVTQGKCLKALWYF